MNDSNLLLFIGVAAGLTLTPGADTLLVIHNTLQAGRRAGWATTLGIGAGLWIHATISSVGLAALLTASPRAMSVLQWAGAATLIVLGLQALKARRVEDADPKGPPSGDDSRISSWRPPFMQGLTTNLLNPKVIVFYLALLPQFIGPGQAVFATSMALASIHVAMGLCWLGGLSAVLARSRSLLQSAGLRQRLNQACGLMLIALGLRMLVCG